MEQERIFLSAVSSEFRTARRALVNALRIPGCEVREQSNHPRLLSALGQDEAADRAVLADAYHKACLG